MEKKMSEVMDGNSARFTRADSADDFDRFDVHAEALYQEEQKVEAANKEIL